MSDSEKARNGFPSGRATKITGAAPAKINLFLHVDERRGDGFHPLQSLAVFTDLADSLSAEKADALSLQVTGAFAPALSGESDNLVLKAARALSPAAGAKLSLTKNLPVASGIGGGSADAAAALRLLSRFWDLNRDNAELAALAAGLGSDIPVCLSSRPSWMEGRGELLTPIQSLPHLPLLLVNPGVAVSTKDVFAGLQSRSGASSRLPEGHFRDMADLLRFLDATRNDLEAPARKIQPVIGEVLTALCGLPGALLARMSGSGATCFGIFPDDESCQRAASLLSQAQPTWWVAPTSAPEFGIDHEDAGQDIGPTDRDL